MDKKKIIKSASTIALIIIGGYIGLMAILTLFQSRLIYFPDKKIVMTPKDIGIPYETVSFKSEDGVKLSGWYIPTDNPKGVILFCHGNAGNISHRLESLRLFYRLGLTIFIFDYRGFGTSEGRPTEEGTYLDAEAAWSYLTHQMKIPPDDIIIFGRSLGASIAARLAGEESPAGLIIESAFTSIPDIAADIYPYLPVKILARFKYDTLDHLRHINCPILIIHSRDDELIPFSHGQRLFEAARQPKEFLEIAGSHNEGFVTSGRGYESVLGSFISGLKGP